MTHGVQMKEAGPSSSSGTTKATYEEKIVNMLVLEKKDADVFTSWLEEFDADVLPLGKRDREEEAGPSTKKSKQTGEMATYQRKKARNLRQKYKTTDYPLGKEQAEYDLVGDLSKRKVDITFG